jgi:polysaccharide biosynthesis/export protein
MVLSLSSVSMSSRPMRLAMALLALCAALLLSGCAGSRGGPIDYNVENFGRPDTPTVLTLEEDYKIGPMDTLSINVFQVEDLSGDFVVDLTGHIALPLLGNVKAVDLTTAELDQKLTQQLGAKYLQSPDVSVGIKSSTRRNLTVDGSVRQPGMYPVNGPMTLIQAIALARGTDDSANPRRVAIFRQIEGKRMAAAFDLVSIRRGQMDDPEVYSGDIIVVDGSNVRAIQREVLTALPILGLFNPILN